MVLDPGTNQAVTNATKAAIDKVRGTKITDEGTNKGTFEPNQCTDMFNNSPLGLKGGYLLGSYIIWRDGTGVRDADDMDVCATGVPAWTTCCSHSPVVFICPGKFNQLSATDRYLTLIHEALHVAGQMEDKDSTVGPNDPPSSTQIGSDVKSACQ